MGVIDMMNFDEELLFRYLKEQNYVHVPFLLEPTAVQKAVDAFFKFLEEPMSIKTHIDFKIAPEHRRGEVGFRHREAEDHIYNDNKDFFQFHPALLARYDDFLTKNPTVADFALKANVIWDLVYKTSHRILSYFETDFPGTVGRVFSTKHPHILVRFLKYEWPIAGKYLAKPHFDAGAFTLAIAESSPGLRIGRSPDDLAIVTHKEGHAIFMLSSNFKKTIPTEELSAGWHDVIQLDDTQIGRPFARWAVVAFIEAHGVSALPRTETHKWSAN